MVLEVTGSISDICSANEQQAIDIRVIRRYLREHAVDLCCKLSGV
jgi:hypothetical protein